MSAFYNSLDFTVSVEVETCVRDPSSFAGQVPRFPSRIKVHLFNTIFVVCLVVFDGPVETALIVSHISQLYPVAIKY